VHPKDQRQLDPTHCWAEYGERPRHVADYCVERAGAQNLDQAAARADYLKEIACADVAQDMDRCTCLAQFRGDSPVEAQSEFRMHFGAERTAACGCT